MIKVSNIFVFKSTIQRCVSDMFINVMERIRFEIKGSAVLATPLIYSTFPVTRCRKVYVYLFGESFYLVEHLLVFIAMKSEMMSDLFF